MMDQPRIEAVQVAREAQVHGIAAHMDDVRTHRHAKAAAFYCFVAAITTCGYGSTSGTLTIRTWKPSDVNISPHSR